MLKKNDGRVICEDYGDDKTKIYFDWHRGIILRKKKFKSGLLWLRYFYVLCFFFVLIYFGSLTLTKSVSRGTAISVMEIFPTLVNEFLLLITNAARISVFNVLGAVDPSLLLNPNLGGRDIPPVVFHLITQKQHRL